MRTAPISPPVGAASAPPSSAPSASPAKAPSDAATNAPAGASIGGLAQLPAQLRLGTRRSALARTQSQWVGDQLTLALAAHGLDVQVELVEVTTHGDVSTAALSSLGGTGVFVSALRDALLAGEIDLAVHSLKDLPTAPAAGLVLAALPPREDPRDVLVARDGLTTSELPPGSRVGTGSPRRAAQLRALGFGLEVVDIRGNVDTRLRLVADNVVDAVVLARAGLLRLDRAGEATQLFDPLMMLPAPGQGALAVEARAGDLALLSALSLLDDASTRAGVLAERALLARLEAGCAAPVGALAEVVEGEDGPELSLRAVVVSLDGAISIRRSAVVALAMPEQGPLPEAAAEVAIELGRSLAEAMIADGADELMAYTTAPTADTAALAREGDS